jgi:monoamine oxidase
VTKVFCFFFSKKKRFLPMPLSASPHAMKCSFHSPLTRKLREAHAACKEAEATGAPIDEVSAWRAERQARLPRRAVLAGAAAALAAPRRARAACAPSVVVVGAGIAGLACARALWRHAGIAASVYEWNSRVGGRINTLRGYFANGITAEQHGQFISSEHRRMRQLAAHYGLTLDDANAHYGDTKDTGWYRGERYSAAELARDWQEYAYRLFRDAVTKAPVPTWRHGTPTAREWDRLSVTEWVERYIPGGTKSKLGGLCLADSVGENGSPPDRQSALNLIYLLGYDTSRPSGYQPRFYPEVSGTDEKYVVAGGNDQITTALAGDLPSAAINLGYQLLAVRETAGRRLTCVFQSGSGVVEVTADHVVLTIPPTTLRDVDLTGIRLLPVQKRALAGATLGNNAKILIQVAGRPWIDAGYSGDVLTDELVCGGWDASNPQPGGRGHHADAVWVGFPGGRPGETLASRYGLTMGIPAQPAPPAMVTDTLAQMEPILPGLTAAWAAGPQKAWVNDGNIDPFMRGAWSNFLVGQYTSFAGAQSLPAGTLHFAGEHTSLAYQGFMEGGLESGLRAAAEIIGRKTVLF